MATSSEQQTNHEDTHSHSRGQRRFRGRGHGRGCFGWSRYDKSEILCQTCKKFGHYSSECYYNTNNDGEKVNLVDKEEGNEGHVLLMAYNGLDAPQTVTWFLDLGASNHKCERKEFFYWA